MDNSNLTNPANDPLPEKVELQGAVGSHTLEIEKLPNNSILIIKIEPEGMQQRIAATQQIAMAIRPFAPRLKEKGVILIVMAASEDITSVTEEQMNQMGWFKKQESLIINPFK